ncbi:MAG: hypothetical protein K940chlam7_00680 [Chlamydiae bacterium]|nr:hypothetical protein [Chlamydiota bacterium]
MQSQMGKDEYRQLVKLNRAGYINQGSQRLPVNRFEFFLFILYRYITDVP